MSNNAKYAIFERVSDYGFEQITHWISLDAAVRHLDNDHTGKLMMFKRVDDATTERGILDHCIHISKD